MFPEVAFWKGEPWCAVQIGDALQLVHMNADLGVVQNATIPLGPGSLAFPRMGVSGGSLWLAYRAQSTAFLVDAGSLAAGQGGTPSLLGLAGGNDPVAIGGGFVAWQKGDSSFTIMRRPLSGGAASTVGPGRPTGLSRLMADGRVTLIDNDRTAVPGGTRPCWAGDMTVVEGPDGGNRASRGGNAVLLWPGATAFTPKCAADAGRYAVATWGDHEVRLAVLKPADFTGASSPGEDLTWTNPPGYGVAHLSGPTRLTGTLRAPEKAAAVQILVNLKKIGEADLSGRGWSFDFDPSPYSGGVNLSALLVGVDGSTARWTIRAEIGGGGGGGGPAPESAPAPDQPSAGPSSPTSFPTSGSGGSTAPRSARPSAAPAGSAPATGSPEAPPMQAVPTAPDEQPPSDAPGE